MSKRARELRASAEQIVSTLRGSGHVAYMAGGCVRDMLLGRSPKDYDVACDASPDRIGEIFPRCRAVGAKFGVMLVRSRGHWIETATFRTDMDYQDGRRPTAVTFSSPQEDAQRRDFTINGMFYDPTERRVIDFVDGRKDLEERVIRAIGDPDRRFGEDRLRIMRAVRFAASLEFEIDGATTEAIRSHAAHLGQISAERLREELLGILVDAHRSRGVRLLWELGILSQVIPESAGRDDETARAFALLDRFSSRCSERLGLGVLLASLTARKERPDALAEVETICRRLTCSNELRRSVLWLVEHHDALTEPSCVSLGSLRLLMRRREFADLRRLHEAIAQAGGAEFESRPDWKQLIERVDLDNIAPPPLITGEDLISLGVHKGPAYKQTLDEVYLAQLDETLTSRDEAIALAKRIIRRLNQ
jgi:poly(A) polymerase